MERIKQALDRARQQRQEGKPPPSAATGTTAAPAGEVADISYTQTRTVPVIESVMRAHRIIAAFPQTPFADSYKILRTQVLQRMAENGWNVLAVTSPGEHEGKTLTAINLAVSLGMEVNYSVLLVDANLRHPSIHELLGLPEERGLSDYLLDEVPLPELLIHPEPFQHVVVLPAGRPVLNSSELLNSPRMTDLVEELKHRYPRRIVIFDLPPVLTAADALAFSPYVDAALLVLEEGGTDSDSARRALSLLDSTHVIGTVLNKAAP